MFFEGMTLALPGKGRNPAAKIRAAGVLAVGGVLHQHKADMILRIAEMQERANQEPVLLQPVGHVGIGGHQQQPGQRPSGGEILRDMVDGRGLVHADKARIQAPFP